MDRIPDKLREQMQKAQRLSLRERRKEFLRLKKELYPEVISRETDSQLSSQVLTLTLAKLELEKIERGI